MKPHAGRESFAVTWQAPNRLKVEGDIDFDNTPAILAASEPLLLNGFARSEAVIVDLEAVKTVKSPGIALMLEWKRLAAERQKKLTFSRTPPSLVRLAEISELKNILEL